MKKRVVIVVPVIESKMVVVVLSYSIDDRKTGLLIEALQESLGMVHVKRSLTLIAPCSEAWFGSSATSFAVE